MDITWLRIFRDVYNEIFTKEITITGKKGMISDFWNMEGNSKIRFDEIMNQLFPDMFSRMCIESLKQIHYEREFNCSNCFNSETENQNCIWSLFLNIGGHENFFNYKIGTSVGDWLTELHNFKEKATEEQKAILFQFINNCFKKDLVELCRQQNLRVGSRKVAMSEKPLIEAKTLVYQELNTLDNTLTVERFDELSSLALCEM